MSESSAVSSLFLWSLSAALWWPELCQVMIICIVRWTSALWVLSVLADTYRAHFLFSLSLHSDLPKRRIGSQQVTCKVDAKIWILITVWTVLIPLSQLVLNASLLLACLIHLTNTSLSWTRLMRLISEVNVWVFHYIYLNLCFSFKTTKYGWQKLCLLYLNIADDSLLIVFLSVTLFQVWKWRPTLQGSSWWGWKVFPMGGEV